MAEEAVHPNASSRLGQIEEEGEGESRQLTLPILQNAIKRDPVAYEAEFIRILRHFYATLEVLRWTPHKPSKEFNELVMFLAHTCSYYQDGFHSENSLLDGTREGEMSATVSFVQRITSILTMNFTSLHSLTRKQLIGVLIVLRNKKQISCNDVLNVWLQILGKLDKSLGRLVVLHIIRDISRSSQANKSHALKNSLQSLLFSKLTEAEDELMVKCILILIELYRRRIWVDIKTVNRIASACHSKYTKAVLAAANFFLGNDTLVTDELYSDDEDAMEGAKRSLKTTRNTAGKKRRVEKVEQASLTKKRKNKAKIAALNATVNFAAIDVLYDPQSFAEKLFGRLIKQADLFPFRLVLMNLISRLIGRHQLLLLNFYPYLQRYINPHQRYVTQILAFVAQATHELIPPIELQILVKFIRDSFVSESQSADSIAIGINTIREMSNRAPLCLTEEMLEDIVGFRNYKNKGVMIAVKSLINVYREVHPELLHRKLRGKEASIALASSRNKIPQYGALNLKDTIEGANTLPAYAGQTHVRGEEDKEVETESEEEESMAEDETEEVDEEEDALVSLEEGETFQEGGTLSTENGESSVANISSWEDISKTTILSSVDFATLKKRRLHAVEETKGNTMDLSEASHASKRRKRGNQKNRETEEAIEAGLSESDASTSDSEAEMKPPRNWDIIEADDLLNSATKRKLSLFERRNVSQRQQIRHSSVQSSKKFSSAIARGLPNNVKSRNKPISMMKQSRKHQQKHRVDTNAKMRNLKKHLKTLKNPKKGLKGKRRKG